MKGKIELTRKIQRIGNSLAVVVPKQIAQLKGWKPKDEVSIVLNERGELVIREMK
ncbi:MAG: AbrB/MazE/SpoVT family DNA-binding domain-containing protein [Candidatus Woesearchaeota archaeon]